MGSNNLQFFGVLCASAASNIIQTFPRLCQLLE